MYTPKNHEEIFIFSDMEDMNSGKKFSEYENRTTKIL